MLPLQWKAQIFTRRATSLACVAKRRKGHTSVRQQDARQVTLVDSLKDLEDPAPVYTTFTLSCDRTGAPLTVVPILNNTAVPMEIETGASVSIMSEETYLLSWSVEL